MPRKNANRPAGDRAAHGTLGTDDSRSFSANRQSKQDLAAELIRAEAPRLAKPSWPKWSGSRPARADEIEDSVLHSQDDGQLAQALRRALLERGRR